MDSWASRERGLLLVPGVPAVHFRTHLRAHRIPDLYAHPAQPVADLSVACQNGTPRLEFAADDARSYIVEASTNLMDWREIGTASEGVPQSGAYSCVDGPSAQSAARYYRVVTQ